MDCGRAVTRSPDARVLKSGGSGDLVAQHANRRERPWDGIVDANTLGLMEQMLIAAGADGPAPALSQFPATLRVLVQITTLAAGNARTFGNLTQYSGKAKVLLDPFGIVLDPSVSTILELSQSPIDNRFPSDAEGVRKDAEKAVPGQPDRLRIIHHPFVSGSDETGVTMGRAEGLAFADFCMLNCNRTRAVLCTMLHEMIHATGLRSHDTDQTSVFSEGSNRTTLGPEHAERFGQKPPTFFAAPRTP
jgi:hypothetical protein